jgi:hypothetical protein
MNDLKVLPSEGFPRQMTALGNCLILLERDYIESGLIDTLPEPIQDILISSLSVLGAIVDNPDYKRPD